LDPQFKKPLIIICILALLLCAYSGFAQSKDNKNKTTSRPVPQQPQLPPQLMPPHPPDKMGQRYFDIDAKRQIENIDGEDALPRSREFKRIDSTYYVGWMYEGVYKFNHAADFLGFKNAAIPLERTLGLIEHDYSKALATRTDNILTLYPIRIILPDYTMAAYYLLQCYNNTDQVDKAYALLRRVQKWKFQMDFYMDTWDYLAWTVHRNRFYTSAKYPFLKNSIDANERLANRYLDTGLMMIAKNKSLNEPLKQYFPGYEERQKMAVYHYKNILYSYSFNIDSAEYYFGLMRKAGRLPHNNYANFMGICGDFRTAEAEYKLAAMQDAADKRLQEWAYYSSIIDIYKAKPKSGVALAKNMIRAAGTTPGYGWYNIALARCMTYDGQISEAQRYADKAADFKELHIGTTLGQSQYDFSIQLLKLINKEQSWEMDKFEHSNWWYNPSVLLSMTRKLGEKYVQQFLIINQFAQNPERDRVIYKLFSTESTTSWDEIWYLVHDFSTQYFINTFQKEAETDNRPAIRKYFALFAAKLHMQQGKYKEAKPILDKLLHDPTIDADYEKLFTARVYQAEAECAMELKNTTAQNEWLYKLYVLYPQLVPYSGMAMNMNLHVSGEIDKEVEKNLRACNINWITNSGIPSVNAYIIFTHTGKNKDITYYVLDNSGNYIVPKQSFAWQKTDEAGTALAYRLFNIGGKDEEAEEETPTTTP
jgi:hypothetical protein